jgi:hypothetical protein
MERVAARYALFMKVFNTLEIALVKFQELQPDDYYYQELRDLETT